MITMMNRDLCKWRPIASTQGVMEPLRCRGRVHVSLGICSILCNLA